MNKLSDEQILDLLEDLNAIAEKYNHYEYGLPTHDEETTAAMIEKVRAIESALAPSTAAQPGDCVMVPKEPTDEMIVAFAETWFSKARPIDDCEMEDCYRAMIAAAPTVSQPQAQSGELTSNWIRDIQKRLIEVGADQDDDVCSLMCEAAVLLAALSAAQSEQEKP